MHRALRRLRARYSSSRLTSGGGDILPAQQPGTLDPGDPAQRSWGSQTLRFSEVRLVPLGGPGLQPARGQGKGGQGAVVGGGDLPSQGPILGAEGDTGPGAGTEEPSQEAGWVQGIPEPPGPSWMEPPRRVIWWQEVQREAGAAVGATCPAGPSSGTGLSLGWKKMWPPATVKSSGTCWSLSPCESILAAGPRTPADVCSGLAGRTGLPAPSKGDKCA